MAGLAASEKRRYVEDNPTFQQALAQIDQQAKAVAEHPKVQDGYAFLARFGQRGIWRDMKPWKWISERAWIVDKDSNLVVLTPHYGQMRLEAVWRWFEKRRLPVRIIVLKARQIGFSTYIQARFFQDVIRNQERWALLIAHKKEIGWEIAGKFVRMLEELRRHPAKKAKWEFMVKTASRNGVSFGEPLRGGISVASAEEDQPGHGITRQLIHISEHPRWPGTAEDIERKTSGLLFGLHDGPETACVIESTANGDTGWFREMFWDSHRAWAKKKLPDSGYRSLFVPWWIHGEYRWSHCWGGTEFSIPGHIPDYLAEEITETLSEEETMLMTRFGCDLDQLAWRRNVWAAKCQKDWSRFHEQNPATPEEAFLASGRPAFDIDAMTRAKNLAETTDLVAKGDLVDESADFQRMEPELASGMKEF